MAKKDDDSLYYLAHPVYLDVPMMVSFLATLDNGVSYTSEVAERLASSKEGQGEGSMKAGIPSLAQWLGLSLSADGKYRRRSSNDESVEAKLVREHTSASLFNILRQRLIETGSMKVLTPHQELADFKVGDLVEVRGTVTGDPLRQVLALATAIAPYLGINLDETPKPTRAKPSASPKRPTGPTPAQAFGQPEALDPVEILRVLKADVAKSKVLDLTMRLDDGRQVVLAASNEYITEATEQYMLAGSFAALGKVTQILKPDEEISLLRRTVFGAIEATGSSSPEEAFAGLSSSMPGFGASNLSVTGPGLQLLPLAIYV